MRGLNEGCRRCRGWLLSAFKAEALLSALAATGENSSLPSRRVWFLGVCQIETERKREIRRRVEAKASTTTFVSLIGASVRGGGKGCVSLSKLVFWFQIRNQKDEKRPRLATGGYQDNFSGFSSLGSTAAVPNLEVKSTSYGNKVFGFAVERRWMKR